MEIVEVTPKEYKAFFVKPFHVFNAVEFTELNASKYDRVHYLTFKKGKTRLGIVLGEREKELLSPVSAPYGGFSFIQNDPSMQTLDAAVEALARWAGERNMPLTVVLPPLFYHNHFLSQCVFALNRSEFTLLYSDINFQIDLAAEREYADSLQYNARKNLSIALKEPYRFYKAETEAQIRRVYEVIRTNRESKGYPLRMTLDNVLDTIRLVPADFFWIERNDTAIAAAQIFHVAEGIVQVVYWGDVPGYGEARPMNYLSYRLVEHYRQTGIRFFDIGPATEHGEPNYGLCEFKRSIGCGVSLKFTYKLIPR